MHRYFFIIILLILLPARSYAAKSINQIEHYLNSIVTFRASFEQYSGGDFSAKRGIFFLAKPGKIKWQYFMPKKLIIADMQNIIYYDEELNEVTYLNNSSILMKILAQKQVNLNEDIMIENFSSNDNYTTITIADKRIKDDTQISKLKLTFKHFKDDQNIQFTGLEIIDINEQITKIVFTDILHNSPIDEEEFAFKDPNFFTAIK